MAIQGAMRACEDYFKASESAGMGGSALEKVVKQQHEVLLRFIVRAKTDKADGTRALGRLAPEQPSRFLIGQRRR